MKTKSSIRKTGFAWICAIAIIIISFSTVLAATDADSDNAKFDSWSIMGPSGGDVRVVTIDPRDANKLYISTLDGQVYRSTDGGSTWSLLVNLNQPQLILDQLMVDAVDSRIIYTSGHRHKAPGGFFRSTDGGATWKEAKELRGESIHSMTQSSFDPKILTVGTTAGVWVSKNSGEDWEKLNSTTAPVNVDSLAVDPRNTSTIYAGTWWRAYKSTDSGQSWRLIKNGMIDDSDVFAISIDPRNAEHVIASACSGIYESMNGGEKWAKIQGIPSQSRRTRDIVQHPTLAGVIYAGTTEGFWMSSNGGRSWSLTTPRNLEVNSIAVHPDQPNRVFIGTNNYGVMVSNDGGRNFVPTNDNFTSRFTTSITADIQDSSRLYATTQNTATGGGYFFISKDGGNNWLQTRNLDADRIVPFSLLQDRVNPSLMYLGTNAGIFRSLDRGESWTPLPAAKAPPKPPVNRRRAPARRTVKKTASIRTASTATTPSATPAGPILEPTISGKVRLLAKTEDGKNGIIAAAESGLYRSYDLTKGWEKLNLGPGIDDNVYAVHISPLRPETIWIGTATSGVIVSHDDGKTWVKTGGAVENVPISSISSDPERPDYVYVGSVQTFYISRDNGKTWLRRGGNLPLGNYNSILINPNNTDEVIISSSLESDGGVFQSEDAGITWKRMDTKDMKLPSRRVWSLAMDPNDPNRIFAGTHSSGVYRIQRQVRASTSSPADQPKVAVIGN